MNLSDLLEIELTPFTIFIVLFYIIVFLLLIREARLWYWHINDLLKEQKKQTETLNEILSVLRSQKAESITNDTQEKSTP